MSEAADEKAGVRRRRLRWAAGGILAACVVLAGALLWRYAFATNFSTVVPGQAYRSAQPSPETLRRWISRYGLRTVVNLRGRSDEAFHERERAAAAAAGVKLIDVRLSARRQPTLPALRRLIEALETAERPLLLHCRDGIDRAGVASVLAAMAIGGQDYAEARREFAVASLGGAEDGIGGLLVEYERHCRDRGLHTGGWDRFRQWAMEVYRPYYYYVDIAVPESVPAAPGETVRLEATITNRSGKVLPAGDGDKTFTLAAFSGSSEAERPEREFGLRTPLPKRDLAPGEGVTVAHVFRAPPAAGRVRVNFDVVEEGRTWFARQGSPTATCVVEVGAAGAAP
jgi:protein tyrosine phosphatase (PTP) superfamily phosphohydrolase (DUF442 family)